MDVLEHNPQGKERPQSNVTWHILNVGQSAMKQPWPYRFLNCIEFQSTHTYFPLIITVALDAKYEKCLLPTFLRLQASKVTTRGLGLSHNIQK